MINLGSNQYGAVLTRRQAGGPGVIAPDSGTRKVIGWVIERGGIEPFGRP